MIQNSAGLVNEWGGKRGKRKESGGAEGVQN